MKAIKFLPNTSHNPNCNIIQGQIDDNTLIIFGVYVNGLKEGQRFCEVYKGRNYIPNSPFKSYSRYYAFGDIPEKYMAHWIKLKDIYTHKHTQMLKQPLFFDEYFKTGSLTAFLPTFQHQFFDE